MLVVKVWCLPSDLTEERLKEIHKEIVRATCSAKGLGIKDQSEMLVLFPKDMMEYGLGEEILIEVNSSRRPTDALNLLPAVRLQFSHELSKILKQLFPKAKIQCSIFFFSKYNGMDCYTASI